MLTMDDVKGWHALLASASAGVLVLLGRLSATRKNMRKDSAEGGLFENLSAALDRSELRRKEEAEAYRQREAEHERRHMENMERLLELSKQVSKLEGMLMMLERQHADAIARVTAADATNQRLLAELATRKQV